MVERVIERPQLLRGEELLLERWWWCPCEICSAYPCTREHNRANTLRCMLSCTHLPAVDDVVDVGGLEGYRRVGVQWGIASARCNYSTTRLQVPDTHAKHVPVGLCWAGWCSYGVPVLKIACACLPTLLLAQVSTAGTVYQMWR